MRRRVLWPDDQGVQWNCDGVPKVLFAFRDFEYSLPGLTAASDVTTGGRLDASAGVLRAEKQQTYRLVMKEANVKSSKQVGPSGRRKPASLACGDAPGRVSGSLAFTLGLPRFGSLWYHGPG